MTYTIRREGQSLGVRTRQELDALVQTGAIQPHDIAETNDRATTVAELLATPPPLPPAGQSGFLVRRDDAQFGPYPLDLLHRYAQEGRVIASDAVWAPGMAMWEPVGAALERHGLAAPAPPGEPDDSLAWMVPVNRSPLAIAAGYLGLFSILLFPAPLALIIGILALREQKRRPRRHGAGRAWFGTIAGALGSLGLLLVVSSLILQS